MSRLLMTLLLFLTCCIAYAQPGTYIHYTTANGLTSNNLYDILQDRKGFIWISGMSGVHRFDGTHFRHFGVADGLPDNEVLRLFLDRYGRIWFFCFNGQIGYYQEGQFYNADRDSTLARIRLKNIPLTFYEGRNGLLHIQDQNGNHIQLEIDAAGIRGGKVMAAPASCYWEDGQDQYRLYGDSVYRNEQWVCSIDWPMKKTGIEYGVVNGNTVYCSGNKGVYIIKNGRTHMIFPRAELDFPLERLFFRKEDEIFTLSNKNGVIRWLKEADSFRQRDQYPDPVNAGKILVDRQGNTWISSLTQGLYYYPSENRSRRTITAQKSWPGKIVTEMHILDGRGIVMGFENGNAALLTTDFALEKTYLLGPRHRYMPVRDILVTAKGKIVFSGSDQRRIAIKGEIVRCDFKDVEADGDTVYFAGMTELGYFSAVTGRKTVFKTEQASGLKTRKYAVWPASRSGRLWFSTIEGLQALEHGTCIAFPEQRHPFLKKRIIDIKEMGEGLLVLVSDASGIALARQDGGVMQVLTGNDLHNGLVKKVQVDQDRLWLAGTAGIGVFRLRDNRLEQECWIDKNTGLQSNDVYAFCFDNEFLYVSSPEGLQKLGKSSLFRKGSKPELIVHRIESGNRAWSRYGSYIDLPAKCKEIKLYCSALSFGSQAKVTFAYRFGSSGHYIESSEPLLTIPVGFEGKEQLFLKCRKGNSDWSPETLFTLRVPIPLHKRAEVVILFFVAALLLASGLSVYFVNRLRRRQINIKDLKLQVALLEIKALQSSMNPHFVFNALNSVQHFVNEGDAYQVNKYLTKFSRLLRSNLNNNAESLISLEKELAYLRDYLELEQLRFGQRLQYSITVARDLNTEHTMIPAMLVQPLVENAILHGILGVDYQGQIGISVIARAAKLIIRIRDNGAGLKTMAEEDGMHRSMGTQTIKSRLALLSEIHKEQYAFHLINNKDSGEGNGATAVLELPLIVREQG